MQKQNDNSVINNDDYDSSPITYDSTGDEIKYIDLSDKMVF